MKFVNFQTDRLKNIGLLSDVEAGIVLKMMAQYASSGNVPDDVPPVSVILFQAIQEDMIYSDERYSARCEINRKVGKMGGRPRKRIPKETDGLLTEADGLFEKPKDKDKDKKKIKHKYGNYNHVLLTDNEKENLLNELDEYKFNLVIEKLDEYIEETGKKYKNHYLTIKRWVIEAVEKDLVKNISTKSISQTKKFIPATQKQCDDAEFKRRLEESNKLLDSLDENIWGD